MTLTLLHPWYESIGLRLLQVKDVPSLPTNTELLKWGKTRSHTKSGSCTLRAYMFRDSAGGGFVQNISGKAQPHRLNLSNSHNFTEKCWITKGTQPKDNASRKFPAVTSPPATNMNLHLVHERRSQIITDMWRSLWPMKWLSPNGAWRLKPSTPRETNVCLQHCVSIIFLEL